MARAGEGRVEQGRRGDDSTGQDRVEQDEVRQERKESWTGQNRARHLLIRSIG